MSAAGKKIRRVKSEEGRGKVFSLFPHPPSLFILVFLFLMSLTLSGCWGPVRGLSVSSQVGKSLTQQQRFTLKNIQGDAVSLDQVLTQNKAVLINFWATWCGYCVEEMPDLVKLHQANKDKGFTVLAVNVGESKEQASLFAQKMNIPFPIVLDEDSQVAEKYGLVGIPMSLLIDPSGRILGEYHSYTRQLETDVEKALKS
jgi:peroxiredoxin